MILLKDVSKLGKRFEVKEVSSGHALNLLIPKGEAIAATPEAMKRLEAEKAKAEGQRKIQEELMAKNVQDLEGLTLGVAGKANEKGHLFAGLHRQEISAEIMKQSKLQVDPAFIQLEQPIKEIGEYLIEVKAAGKSAKLKLVVKPD